MTPMTRQGRVSVVRAIEPAERSVGELFGELATQMSTLVRQEVRLASTELSGKAAYAGRQAAYVLSGLLIGVVSLLSLLGALIFALATVIELWQSALVVGVVAALAAFVVTVKGVMGLKRVNLVPEQTVESIREDKRWVEQRVR